MRCRILAMLMIALATGCSKEAPPPAEPPNVQVAATTIVPKPQAEPKPPEPKIAVPAPAEFRAVYIPVRFELDGVKSEPILAAFSANGKRFISVDLSGQVNLWDASTGQRLKRFAAREAFKDDFPPVQVAVSPDLKWLAFGGCKRDSAILWNVETGQEEKRLPGHDDFVRCLAFSPDGATVATTTNSGNVSLWETASGQRRKQFKRDTAFINNMVVTPDGKELVTGGMFVQRFNLETGEEVGKIKPPVSIATVAVSRDGRYVAGGSSGFDKSYTLAIWERASGTLLHTIKEAGFSVASLDFGNDNVLAIGANQGFGKSETQLVDAATGHRICRYASDGPRALSPDGKTITMKTGGVIGATHHFLDLGELKDGTLQTALVPAAGRKAFFTHSVNGVVVGFSGDEVNTAALAPLKLLTNPFGLELRFANSLNDEIVNSIAGMPALRSLTIGSDALTDEHVKRIGELTNLKSLDLSGCMKLTPAGLAPLGKLANLEKLTLGLKACDLPTLKALAGFKNLRSVSIAVDDLGEGAVAVIASFPALTELRITGTLDDACVKQIGGIKKLRSLEFAFATVTEKGFAHLGGLTSLEVLDLSGTGIDDAGLAHLKGLVNLRTLNLDQGKLTDEGLAHLAGMTKLKSLSIQGLMVGPGLKHLKNAKDLVSLDLVYVPVTNNGLAGIADLTQLRSLRLPQTTTDAGLVHLKKLVNLETINLQDLKDLNGSGLAALKHAKAITELELTYCAISDEGLAGLKDWTYLEKLRLGKTISDKGLAHLKGNPVIRSLHFEESKGVTDASIPVFESMKSLKYVGCSKTGITKPALEALKKRKPDFSFSHYSP